MRHRDAIELLADHVCGTVEDGSTAALDEHLSGCSECREWLETARLLRGALRAPAGAEAEDEVAGHLDAGVLALCAVRPEEALESDRGEVLEHLERCPACRGLVELTAEAVRQARPGGVGRSARQRRLSWPAVRRRVLLAAATVAATAIALAYVGHLVRKPVGPAEGSAAAVWQGAVGPESVGETLSDLELEGSHVIESDRALRVANVKIRNGARVRLRARDVVVFSDGFRVGEGSSLAVEVAGSGGRTER